MPENKEPTNLYECKVAIKSCNGKLHEGKCLTKAQCVLLGLTGEKES